MCTEEAEHKVTITLVRTVRHGEGKRLTDSETLLYSQQERGRRGPSLKHIFKAVQQTPHALPGFFTDS